MFSPKAIIDILLELVECYLKTTYEVTEIATKYEHLVLCTPLYHPTPRQIELIKGMVKNRIARNPAKNGKDVVAKVVAGLGQCKGDWMNVYRHAQKNEDDFAKAGSYIFTIRILWH
ncbi:hypothetical protein BBJ28_00025759 [Nothophytophthora sp. Chile5]|nr:hypothetical protein BBJ28_00025759 [Nothophytophthora sp. Chile5]